MAERLWDPVTMVEALEGFREFSRRFEEIAARVSPTTDDIVRFIRAIPASDTEKKRELAKFFDTDEGSRFTTHEREAAYDDLLGRERNKENRG